MTKSTFLVALLPFLTGFAKLRAAPLDDAFRNPAGETKPWCCWYWLKNDISKEGVTKDLEAMPRVGIKLAMIGNIEGGGPVKMFSPEWYAITRHPARDRSLSTEHANTSMRRIPAFISMMVFASQIHTLGSPQAWREKREIWFTRSAQAWKLGLPVGKGPLGALVAGAYPKEPMARHSETTRDKIAEVQKLVDAGKYKAAHDLYESGIIMAQAPGIGSCQTMGDLWIEHVGKQAPAAMGHRRSLDVATGLETVSQPLSDGSVITRETHASAVDDCIAVQLSTTASGGLNFDFSMTHPIRKIRPAVAKSGDALVMEGQAQYDKGKDPYPEAKTDIKEN